MSFGLPPRFEESYTYDAGESHLRQEIERTLEALGWKWSLQDNGHYLAKVGITWRSWGERVVIAIEDKGTVRVASRSSWSTTIIDYGKNQMNVKAFFAELNRVLHAQPLP